jgi:hypothetical protein
LPNYAHRGFELLQTHFDCFREDSIDGITLSTEDVNCFFLANVMAAEGGGNNSGNNYNRATMRPSSAA